MTPMIVKTIASSALGIALPKLVHKLTDTVIAQVGKLRGSSETEKPKGATRKKVDTHKFTEEERESIINLYQVFQNEGLFNGKELCKTQQDFTRHVNMLLGRDKSSTTIIRVAKGLQ